MNELILEQLQGTGNTRRQRKITPVASRYLGFDSDGKLALLTPTGGGPLPPSEMTSATTHAYAASVTPDLTKRVQNYGTLTGPITINSPGGAPADGQVMVHRFTQDATGGRLITWNAIFDLGTTPPTQPTTASKRFSVITQYNLPAAKWEVLSYSGEF